jgi:hypothetical protein
MSTRRRPIRPTIALLSAVVLGFAGAAWSAPAVPQLEPSMVGKADASFSDAEKKSIAAVVEAARAGLTSDDPAVISRTRTGVLTPLRAAGVGLGFRVEYAQQLVPALRSLAADKRDEVAVNALRIAGELGTRSAADVLVEALKDPREAVRLVAGMGLRRTFASLAVGTPGLSPQQSLTLVRDAGKALGTEKSAAVAETLVIALESAVVVPDAAIPDLRLTALDELTAQVGARARAPDAGRAFVGPVLRAGRAARTALSNVNPADKPPTPATLAGVAGLAGDTLAMVVRRLAAQPDAGERAELATLAGQSEAVYALAHTGLGGSPTSLRLEPLITPDGTKDEQFVAAVAKLIGPGGTLTQPPFSFKPERFAAK